MLRILTRNFKVREKLFTTCLKRTMCDAQCVSSDIKKGLVLGCFENESGDLNLTPAACKFDERMQGKLIELIRNRGNTVWKAGGGVVLRNIEDEFWTVAVVGLGKLKAGYNQLEAIDESRENVRYAAGLACQHLLEDWCSHIFVEGLTLPEQAAEGAALAVWRYQDFKNRTKRYPVPTLELYEDMDHEAWQRGLFKAEAQNVARRLCEIPANHLTPTGFAQETVKLLCPCGIKVVIHDREWLQNRHFNTLLTAARGSCEPPILIEIQYCGADIAEKPICVIGKGITFDTGGLCLKPAAAMRYEICQMSGAASVVALLRAAAMLSLPVNLYGLIPLCENFPSGMAGRCGDIIRMLNGLQVELEDTGNEGRLVVADTLTYAQHEFSPKLLIDVTAMTPGAEQLLDSAASACFSNSEFMWKQIRKAGVITGDRLWRLPLWKFYKRKMESYTHCDVNNVGRGGPLQGESCLGAAFLTNFIDCVDWIHLDIWGTGRNSHCQHIYPYYKWDIMMGRPVRTLIQFIYQLACPNECDTTSSH